MNHGGNVLAGKTALVTGAGRGIGRGCALELAKAGADLVMNDRPGSEDLGVVAEEIRAMGRNCSSVEANVFERAGCEELVAAATADGRQIDILVSNPALGARSSFLEFDPTLFERVVNSTLVAGFHVSQLVARHMVERGRGGKIIFISSVMGEMPLANSVAYSAAKAGVNHMARVLSVELAAHHINVNAIAPGWIDTPGEREHWGMDAMQRGAAQMPLRRLGTPSDIGKAAVFLASDASDYVTGTVVTVDGGFRAKDCGKVDY